MVDASTIKFIPSGYMTYNWINVIASIVITGFAIWFSVSVDFDITNQKIWVPSIIMIALLMMIVRFENNKSLLKNIMIGLCVLILFAVGAGDQVVAVDSMSNYPTESAAVLTDISAYEPNVEAISALEPDLVIIGDDFSGLAEQLSAIGVASLPCAIAYADLNAERLFATDFPLAVIAASKCSRSNGKRALPAKAPNSVALITVLCVSANACMSKQIRRFDASLIACLISADETRPSLIALFSLSA